VCADVLNPHPCVHNAHTYVHLQASTLKAAGVDKVVCVTVGDPKEVQQWAASKGFDKAAMVSSWCCSAWAMCKGIVSLCLTHVSCVAGVSCWCSCGW
jgi:peroxiredoxin